MKKSLALRRSVALLLALVMWLGCLAPVSADSGLPYQYEGLNGSIFGKLSHKNLPPRQTDGLVNVDATVDNPEGTGEPERGHSYSWSMITYGDWVYVGTNYNLVGSGLLTYAAADGGITPESVMALRDKVDALYAGTMFLPETFEGFIRPQARLLKIHAETGETKIVRDKLGIMGYRCAALHDGKIYFATTNQEVIQVDPENNDAVEQVYTPPHVSDPSVTKAVRSIASYKGRLVVTINMDDGAHILESLNPSEGQSSFHVVADQQDLFNYPAYHYEDKIYGGAVWEFTEFNGDLYLPVVAGGPQNVRGFALIKAHVNDEDEWSFEAVIGDPADGAKYPFGLDTPISGTASVYGYGDHLYIGGFNDSMRSLQFAVKGDFKHLHGELSQPVEMWRMDKEGNIEKVLGRVSTDLFPQRIGNLGPGYGSVTNQYTWKWQEYNGKLYVGTFDISSFLYPLMRFVNKEVLQTEVGSVQNQINYILTLLRVLVAGSSRATIPATDGVDSEDIQNMKEAVAQLDAQQADKLKDELQEIADKLETVKENLNLAAKDTAEETLEAIESLEEKSDDLAQTLDAADVELPSDMQERLGIGLSGLFDPEKIANLRYFIDIMGILSRPDTLRGFDLLVTEDGVNFDVVTRSGFDDPYNYGTRNFGINEDSMFVGTSNPFYGTQVWKLTDPDTIKVTFDAADHGTMNGAKTKTVNVPEGSSIGNRVPSVQADSGWNFTGWKHGGIVYSPAKVSRIVPEEAMHFTAVYKAKASDPGTPGTPQPPVVDDSPKFTVVELAGEDRYDTAIAVSQETFNSAKQAVLASGEDYPDALAASPLAAQLNGPLLLNPSKALDARVKAELERLGVEKVVLAGGEKSLSQNIADALEAAGMKTERIAGESRYVTAAKITERVKELSGNRTEVVLASGLNYADALSVAPYAGKQGVGILLTDTEALDPATVDQLNDVVKTVIVGGSRWIPESIEKAVQAKGINTQRIAGDDRYMTAVAIAKTFFVGAKTAVIASGEVYPDALAGAQLAIKHHGPILLVRADKIDAGVLKMLKESDINKLFVLGGNKTISQSVRNQLRKVTK